MSQSIRELDAVVLLRDRPEDGLHAGAVGAVVHVYAPDAFEVEFVAPSGRMIALTTLRGSDVRLMRDDAA